jgi:hypothetical protein
VFHKEGKLQVREEGVSLMQSNAPHTGLLETLPCRVAVLPFFGPVKTRDPVGQKLFSRANRILAECVCMKLSATHGRTPKLVTVTTTERTGRWDLRNGGARPKVHHAHNSRLSKTTASVQMSLMRVADGGPI